MKEYKFEVNGVYTDTITKKIKIVIVKITKKCIYFRVIECDKNFDDKKIYRARKYTDALYHDYHDYRTMYYAIESFRFPRYLEKKLGYSFFSARWS